MYERINRRMEALQKQIAAEKEAKGKPQDGLTTTTAVERYHAKREEERKMADCQDTDPASGVPLCAPTEQLHDNFSRAAAALSKLFDAIAEQEVQRYITIAGANRPKE